MTSPAHLRRRCPPAGTRRCLFASVLVLVSCGSSSTAVPADASSITLSSNDLTFSSLLATQPLTATVRDVNGSTISVAVTWSTNASGVATVSNSGQVTAVGNGTAEITASVGSVQSPAATVTVQQIAATLTLSPDTLRLAAVSDTATIGRTVRDALGSTMSGVAVTFAVVDPSIATVVPSGASSGRVTAQADGATTLTAQVAPGGPGLTKNIRVEVGGDLPPAYLVGGYVGVAYADQLDPASGGGASFTYTVTAGALPPGLSLNSTTRQITGMPSTSGVHFFQVTATNGVLTLTERYAITISTKASSAFNLWIAFNGGPMPPANVQTAVTAAHARWEQIVTGDLATVTYSPSGLTPTTCQLVDASLLNGAVIEDAAILMSIDSINGPGGTLAQGGFCGYGRPTAPGMVTGQMRLDEADAGQPAAYLEDVLWHEIGHAFGIGTLWQASLVFAATDSVRYSGTNGKAEWVTLGGPSQGGPADVPLEPQIAAHWNEGWFNNEIMTPITEGPAVPLPISRMTIGTLMDLGWTVSLTAADAFVIPGCRPTCTIREPAGAPGEGAFFNDAVFDRLLPLPPGAVGQR